MEKPYLIAEIGINHNGDINIAKRLIDNAVNSNFNAVRISKRTIDIVYSKDQLNAKKKSPWGTTQREQKEN